MNKKSKKRSLISIFMILVLSISSLIIPINAKSEQIIRISGVDRYATAAQVAVANWPTSDTVVLVSGEGYADAVSAVVLAKKLNVPILLTQSNSLNNDTKNALSSLKTKNIYIVGGNASVSESVRRGLRSQYRLTELKGNSRYETNAAVARELLSLGVSSSDVLLVGGEGFCDALSVAPIAASKGQILLLGSNNIDDIKPIIDFVKTNNSAVTIIGTKNIISDNILSILGKAKRIDGGQNRFNTNQKILEVTNSYK